MQRKTQGWNNWLLVVVVLGLAIAPLFIARNAEFGGADGEAEAAIQEANPDYEPWFSPILEPASGEIESLLFALQAALGAGVIGYVVGLSRGRQERNSTQHDPEMQPPPSNVRDY